MYIMIKEVTITDAKGETKRFIVVEVLKNKANGQMLVYLPKGYFKEGERINIPIEK